jgi:hypothetical protein
MSHPSRVTRTGPSDVRLYEDESDSLISPDLSPDRVTLLPAQGHAHDQPGLMSAQQRCRIMWGQDLFRDVVDGRYRAIVCGINDADNAHGIISKLVDTISTSQWSSATITSYARMFQESSGSLAGRDKEPFVLKYDLDSVLILALLRPKSREWFTLDDLHRGFSTVAKMTEGRRERLPIASVSFLNARANRLVQKAPLPGQQPVEPSFEAVLRTMYSAGFRGDVYPPPAAWRSGHVGVFPSYPFPEGLTRAREGSS